MRPGEHGGGRGRACRLSTVPTCRPTVTERPGATASGRHLCPAPTSGDHRCVATWESGCPPPRLRCRSSLPAGSDPACGSQSWCGSLHPQPRRRQESGVALLSSLVPSPRAAAHVDVEMDLSQNGHPRRAGVAPWRPAVSSSEKRAGCHGKQPCPAPRAARTAQGPPSCCPSPWDLAPAPFGPENKKGQEAAELCREAPGF